MRQLVTAAVALSLAVVLVAAQGAVAAGSKATRPQPSVSTKLCADPAFIKRVTAAWNKHPHTGPDAAITSLTFETVVRTDCVYEIRTRTDPDPATLVVTPKRGGRFFMSLAG
jgi:hypothetical protein